MNEVLGWAMVGMGARARECLLPALMASPRSRLVGVCGRDADKTREQCSDWPELSVFSRFEEMAQSPEVHIIYICTPHFLHVPQAVQAIESGKHVFMESPMALSVDGAHKLVEKARNMNVSLGVAFNHRFHSSVRELKKIVMDGVIGSPVKIDAALYEPETPDGWWLDSMRSGPAALLRLGVHAIDLATWVMGEPVTEVMSMGDESSEREVNTICGSLLRFESGALGAACGAFNASPARHLVEVHGDKGWARISGDLAGNEAAALSVQTEQGITETLFEPEDPIGAMVDRFVDSIENENDYSPGGLEGKAVVQVTCAIIDSMKSKRAVRVGEVQRVI